MDATRYEVISCPSCPTCGVDVKGYNYDAVLVTVSDEEPLWDGGPMYPVAGTERQEPIPGAGYTAMPCGHPLDPVGMSWTVREKAAATVEGA